MTIRRNRWRYKANATSSTISGIASGGVGLMVTILIGFMVFSEVNDAIKAETNISILPIVDFDISDNVKYINDSNLNNTTTTRTYDKCFKDMTKQGYNTYAIESLCTQETGGN